MNSENTSAGANLARDRLIFRDDIRPDEVFFIHHGDDLEVVVLEINPLLRGLSSAHLLPMELISDRTTFVDFFAFVNRQFVDIAFPDGTVVPWSDMLIFDPTITATSYVYNLDVC